MAAITKELEEVVEIVSDRLADLVITAIDALTGGTGVPFDWEAMSKEEQQENYLLLRHSPDAWTRYIEGKTQGFIQKLKDQGLDEEKIASIHPYSVVMTRVLSWSAEMEKEIGNAVSS